MERQKHHDQIEDQTGALTGILNILDACESCKFTTKDLRRVEDREIRHDLLVDIVMPLNRLDLGISNRK